MDSKINNQNGQWISTEALIFCLFAGSLLITGILYFSVDDVYSLFKENGIVENIQVFVLLISMLSFILNYFSCHIKGISFFSAVVCLGFLLRELDVEKFNIAKLWIVLGSGAGRNTILAALGCWAVYLLIKEIRWRHIKKLSNSPFFICLCCTLFYLVGSWLFDKGVISINNSLILEELSEVNAYVFIILSSVFYFRQFRCRQCLCCQRLKNSS